MSDSIVIVGASLGGLRTAEAIRRFGYDGEITVIGDEPVAPYNRTPLSKDALLAGPSHEDVAFPQREITADIDWVLGTQVVAADLASRTVTDATGSTYRYAALVIATGVRARRLEPQRSLPGVHALRTLADAVRLHSDLHPGARVVIAGAGFIGCEVAATARQLGCEVTVVDATHHPMQRALGAQLARDLQHRHTEHGVRFEMNTLVAALHGDDQIRGVVLDDGRTLACDILIEALGSVPNTEWLWGNDLDTGQGVLTDSAMRALRHDGTPWPDVYAVGDIARFPNPVLGGDTIAVEHWNMPTETGRRAGRVLALQAGGDRTQAELETALVEAFAPVPSFWSDQFEMHLLAYGLPGLGERAQLVHGVPGGDCVYEYHRQERLVGVCGISYRSVMQEYRRRLAGDATPPAEPVQPRP